LYFSVHRVLSCLVQDGFERHNGSSDRLVSSMRLSIDQTVRSSQDGLVKFL
jgi:hypothetical protein